MARTSEEKILEAAQRIFTRFGYEGARMQQIADEAEVNKSMLHYYFRSKKKLFEEVYRDAVVKLMPQLLNLLNADLPLEEKIPKLVRRYITLMRDHPRLPGFIIQELHQNREEWLNFMDNLDFGKPKKFLEQVRRNQEQGKIVKIEPRQLLINILSLCVFPFAAQPMIKYMLKMDDAEFENFLDVRVESLSTFILNAITP